jgi:protein-S-isoprenylcysteine O-methyltransferase Ste14
VYLFFAWGELHAVLVELERSLPTTMFSIQFAIVVRHVVLLLLQSFIGLMLLFNQKPAGNPQQLKEILVPLATSFFFLVYNTIPSLPAPLQTSLFPSTSGITLTTTALLFGAMGAAISTWGVMHLGRSFGIFVSVRDIVHLGPYRYVRHPIYLGYIFILTGLVLMNLSVAIFVLVPLHVLLLIYRARLEEFRLAQSSVSYRAYMEQTGFILPRLSKLPS